MSLVYTTIAAGYDCDAYGVGDYGLCNASTATDTASAGGSGFLADTGYDVLLPMALALAIAGAAVILLVKRLVRKRRQAQQTL